MSTDGLDFLDKILGPLIAPPKRKRKVRDDAKYYAKFRRITKKLGTTYTVDNYDGCIYIEPFEGYPDGINTNHYNWMETLQRLQKALERPRDLDPGGWWIE